MKPIREALSGVPIYQSEFGFVTDTWSFGNHCLPGVPYEKALELAKEHELTIDFERKVLEQTDIDAVNVGDRVTITKENFFAGTFTEKATVVAKRDDEITVRKYRAQHKGWRLRVGDIGNIVAGW